MIKDFEKLVKILIEQKMTISSAESCTGGMFASSIVDVADASHVLNAAVVTYANEAKTKYAGVDEETLAQYGAVSEQVAGLMASGIAKNNNADVGVSFSGIAGPGGGTATKPVGTVCMGFWIKGDLLTETVVYDHKSRNEVRAAAVEYACDKLIKLLSQH